MRGHVPAEQTVDDRPAKTHLLAGLWVGVQRVVVAIQAVNVCGLHGGLDGAGCVRRAVGGWVARNLGAWWDCKYSASFERGVVVGLPLGPPHPPCPT